MKEQTLTESNGHILGKELAKFMLMKERFYKREIKEEYPVIFPTGKVRIVDVVGICIPCNKKYVYEVGNLTGGSLEELYCLFNKVENIKKVNIEEDKLRKIFEFFKNEIEFYEKEVPLFFVTLIGLFGQKNKIILAGFCH